MGASIEWEGRDPIEQSLAAAREYLENANEVEIVEAKVYHNKEAKIVILIDDFGEQYYEDDGEWILMDDIEEVLPGHTGVEDISF